ncbi:hypothetical protein BN133_3262 [Cronobacter dublinensis 582]|nr:hypothetical protein BN133_3262 [Cronobacter dublinensis 582]
MTMLRCASGWRSRVTITLCSHFTRDCMLDAMEQVFRNARQASNSR